MYRFVGFVYRDGSFLAQRGWDWEVFDIPDLNFSTGLVSVLYAVMQDQLDLHFHAVIPSFVMRQHHLNGAVTGETVVVSLPDLDALIVMCAICASNPRHGAEVFVTEKETKR